MRKIASRFAMWIVMLAVLLSLSITAMAVNSTTSTEKTATVLGYTYTYKSMLFGDGSCVWAYVDIQVADDKNVPTGYVGLNSNLYNDGGALVKTTGWEYSETDLNGWSITAGKYYETGSYYSKGQVKLYNGNGYYTYTANASPNLMVKSSALTQVRTNDKGQTYGSDMLVECGENEPDLILAIGTNGVEGYVYSSEVYGERCSSSPSRLIPLYKKDGITVIGTFEISVEESETRTA